MTQQWNPTGGRFDVEPLENINEVADLPDLAQLDEAQIYSIRSGNFAPDYIVPWAWDSSAGEYQEWRSTVDGRVIRDIPDTDADQIYEFDGHEIHVFESDGYVDANSQTEADILLVGGGGGGGWNAGGGGGAGGLVYYEEYTIPEGQTDVTVGDGGLGGYNEDTRENYRSGTQGENSEFDTLTAIGGGPGQGGSPVDGAVNADGGSSGASSQNTDPSSNDALQPGTNSGATLDEGQEGSTTQGGDEGSGGGGAGESGSGASGGNGGDGGAGIDMSDEFDTIIGEDGWFAGGGGGGADSTPGSGGVGGGADGSDDSNESDGPIENTGGGGGGADDGTNFEGTKGADGIVAIKFEL